MPTPLHMKYKITRMIKDIGGGWTKHGSESADAAPVVRGAPPPVQIRLFLQQWKPVAAYGSCSPLR